jgi:hypothetical protein
MIFTVKQPDGGKEIVVEIQMPVGMRALDIDVELQVRETLLGPCALTHCYTTPAG